MAAVVALAIPQVSWAHPLGNFTVNRYSRLELGSAQIALLYVVDMAEIPTFQEHGAMDADGDGQISDAEQQSYLAKQAGSLTQNLHLSLGGQELALQPQSQAISMPAGQGGLSTLRMELRYSAAVPAGDTALDAAYRDDNFAGRIGWAEIVVQAASGARLLSSDVPAEDRSQELRSYPQDLLQSPPALTSAAFRFQAAPAAAGAERQPSTVSTGYAQAGQPVDKMASLITLPVAGPVALLLAIITAFGLGAAHALAPGHGKTIVAAYLVGARGTAKHALFLGITTTITHTAGVFALGLVTLFVSQFILPEQLYPWLGVLSGLMVLVIGIGLIRARFARLRAERSPQPEGPHEHDAEGYHSHGFGVYHSHAASQRPAALGWRNLLLLGISGGLLPCPSALVVMLSSIALGRVGFGLVLIIAFSLGLASVLTLVGVLLVRAGRLFSRIPSGGPLLRALPIFSALVIIVAGAGITAEALASALR